ncbi:MAG: hypothetical protein ISQ32_03930 [Rickettsiales bacterium]|nr:hypothetical protein [Rickettsiales bacterium]
MKFSFTRILFLIFSIFVCFYIFKFSSSVKIIKNIDIKKLSSNKLFEGLKYSFIYENENLLKLVANEAIQENENKITLSDIVLKNVQGSVAINAKADLADIDEDKKLITFSENVSLNYNDNLLITKVLEYNFSESIARVPGYSEINNTNQSLTSEYLSFNTKLQKIIFAKNIYYRDKEQLFEVFAKQLKSHANKNNIIFAYEAAMNNSQYKVEGDFFKIILNVKAEKITKIDASGNINMIHKDYTISADSLSYDPAKGIIEFLNNVIMKSKSGEIVSDRLVYDVTNDLVKVKNNQNKKIKTTLDMVK